MKGSAFLLQKRDIVLTIKMDVLVAPVAHIRFDLEEALSSQSGVMPLPFAGMDKSGAAVCGLYVQSSCEMGTSCPFRHVRGDKVTNQMFGKS